MMLSMLPLRMPLNKPSKANLNIDAMGLPDEIASEVERRTATYDFQKLSEKGQNGYLFIARNRVIDRKVAIKFYYWADGIREHIELSP